MKARLIVGLIITALISSGITYAVVSRSIHPVSEEAHSHMEKDKAREEDHSSIDIDGLELAAAAAGEGWDMVEATGKIVVPSDGLIRISPRIEGKVVAAYGNVGDAVRRGQVMAIISSVELAEARTQYRQAKSRLDAANKLFEQEKKLVDLGANSRRPLEEARSESLSAQGDLADAKSENAQAKSNLAQAESELIQCKARLDRARELYTDNIVSKQDVETAEAEYKRDSAAVDAAKSNVTRAESQVRKAESKLDISRQYLAREERVYKSKVVDTRAIQGARSAVVAAQLDFQSSADRIRVLGANPGGSGDTIAVISPISGRITQRQTNVGQMASPSDTLFTVADLSKVWVEADVYEKDLARVRRGQSVEIKVDTYPGRVFAGKVDSIDDILAADSRTARVRCVISNSQRLLRGEMFAKISVLTQKRGKTILVPRQAVLDESGKKIVFTPCLECPEDVKAGTNACGAYDKIEVATGGLRGDRIEILSGLEPGTMVVTTGAYQLKSALGSGKLEAGCSH